MSFQQTDDEDDDAEKENDSDGQSSVKSNAAVWMSLANYTGN